MNQISAKTRITAGLASLVVSVLLVSALLGVLPDRQSAILDGRKQLCEALAINSSVFVTGQDMRRLEVTLGGVSTKQLSSKTMECKHQPGLYFIGEVVDVTGHLGGYNFQWAWSSGHVAGLAV